MKFKLTLIGIFCGLITLISSCSGPEKPLAPVPVVKETLSAVKQSSNKAKSTKKPALTTGYSYKVKGKSYKTLSSGKNYQKRGAASWYGKPFHGRKTASGEIFNMYAMTAAHRSLPFGTRVRVTNLNNNKSVVVKINDRGPFHGNRLIDLSYAAAKKLDFIKYGVTKVKVSTK